MEFGDDKLEITLDCEVPAEIWHAEDVPVPAHHQTNNSRLLEALHDLEEQPPHESDEDVAPYMHEIARLDRKLSFMLRLMGELLNTQRKLPPVVPLKLKVHELLIRTTFDCKAGDAIWAALYLMPEYPVPLVLTGNLQEPCEDGWVSVALDALPSAIQDSFEKYIFRHHRRKIANDRKKANF